jgi:sugar phosphate isomerase/epimerase
MSSRREFLRYGLTGLFGLGLTGRLLALAQNDPYRPFRMGIQSYSLRGFSFDQAVEKTRLLGLHYLQAYPGHYPMDAPAAERAESVERMRKAKIELQAWGVQGFDGDEAAARRVFEFAKANGIRVITADPSKEALPILDRLVAEFGIAIAIHNHGPGSRYDKLASVLEAVEGRHKLLGACIDTGHALRSGENPVEWAKRLGKRVHDVHLKDVKDAKTWKVLGEGDLDVIGFLRELKATGFAGVVALEYEENAENPMPDIERCLAVTRKAIGEVRGAR